MTVSAFSALVVVGNMSNSHISFMIVWSYYQRDMRAAVVLPDTTLIWNSVLERKITMPTEAPPNSVYLNIIHS